MKKKKQNRVILRQWVIVLLLICVLVLGGFSCYLLYRGLNPESKPRKELYTYSYNDSVDYRVKLKPNSFFTTDYLGMRKQYISSLIDNFDITMKYNLSSSKELEYTYDYSVIATAKGTYSDADGKSDEVWSRDYVISPSESHTVKGSNINISKSFTISYDEYNKIVSDFRNQSGLSVDSSVDVALKVNVRGHLPGKDNSMDESAIVKLNIGLLKPTSTVEKIVPQAGNNTIYEGTSESAKIDYVSVSISTIILVISIILIIILSKKLLNATKKSEYAIYTNKILKDYGDIIAETDNLPDLSEYDVVNIQKFEDLVDIEEELHSPILANEVRADLETWYIVLSGKTAYKYVLKYENLGKINNNI